jgi:hypothetical protein
MNNTPKTLILDFIHVTFSKGGDDDRSGTNFGKDEPYQS